MLAGGSVIAGYNGQIAVDAARQIIIAQRLATNPADFAVLIPLVDQTRANLGRKPREVSGDSGFATEDNPSVDKAARYYATMGFGSFAAGNAEGGLTTIEEKSLGAYAKSGSAAIAGLIKPGDIPPHGGLFLLDVVPDSPVRWGFPNISDNAEIVELIACGAHCVLFVTGRGSVVVSALAPIVKICANPETFRHMPDDMDVDAGRILEGRAELAEVGAEIADLVLGLAAGGRTKSEALGHQEFILTYKSLDPIGPACPPGR